jgi:hypothetical protein
MMIFLVVSGAGMLGFTDKARQLVRVVSATHACLCTVVQRFRAILRHVVGKAEIRLKD